MRFKEKATAHRRQLPGMDLISNNLDNSDDDFKALFPTPPLPMHSVDWGRAKNLPEDTYMDL